MKRLFITAAIALALAGSSAYADVLGPSVTPTAAPLHSAAGGRGIEGTYIVVVREGADPRAVAAIAGVKPKFVYTAALNGFAASLNYGQLNALRHHPSVEYVEEDQVVEGDTTQTDAPWGLDRIDQSYFIDGNYTYASTGSGVYAYVIDSGIYYSHPEFGGRASIVYDAVGSGGLFGDCHGHGTHVAGIIGSATYGVAKEVNLRGVRVLDCNNTGATSTVIAGVDWVRYYRTNPAVANISTSGGYSSALNTAVTNLSNSGVFVAVAAGNANQDACNFSPASATAATTVAASYCCDERAYWFSNYGSCVDLYAPGVNIESTWLYDTTWFLDGTSMSAPFVTGVAALYKATYGNTTSSYIDYWLKLYATHNVISGNPSGTPNRLLFSNNL